MDVQTSVQYFRGKLCIDAGLNYGSTPWSLRPDALRKIPEKAPPVPEASMDRVMVYAEAPGCREPSAVTGNGPWTFGLEGNICTGNSRCHNFVRHSVRNTPTEDQTQTPWSDS